MVDEFAPYPMSATKGETDKPAVKIHPPTVLFAAIVAGYIIRLFVGGRLPLPRAFAEGLGGFLILVALGLMMMAIRIFVEEGQPLMSATPAKELFQKGPYRFPRNPLYLAMMHFGAGFGVATSNVWIIITTAVAGTIIQFMAILPEEAYLERKFGEEYAAYKARVRRWV